jgi:hypothetical protein
MPSYSNLYNEVTKTILITIQQAKQKEKHGRLLIVAQSWKRGSFFEPLFQLCDNESCDQERDSTVTTTGQTDLLAL